MTAREVRPVGGRWPVADRSVLGTVLGLPPVGAVGLATVLTAVGVFVDLMRIGSLGTVFTVCFAAGCVLAVAWVRRGGLFGPMVQPPLLVGVAVPAIVLLAGTPAPGAGLAEQLLVIGAPLVNAFPVMAWTTGAVLLLGLVRLLVQRPPARDKKPPTRKGTRADAAAKGKAAAGKAATGKSATGKSTAGKSSAGKSTAGKSATGKAATGKAATGKAAARKPRAERAARGDADEDPGDDAPRRKLSERRAPPADAARGEGRRSGSPRRS
jgi:hypothetical protein